MSIVGTVREIWRYPVKSMAGESVDSSFVETGGLQGDRAWAVRDDDAGEIRSAKKLSGLMRCAAAYEGVLAGTPLPPPRIRMPDGSVHRADDPAAAACLSELLGRSLSLWPRTSDPDHYRLAASASTSDIRKQFGIGEDEPDPDLSELPLRLLLKLSVFATPPGTYFDAYPLHILTTASLTAMREAASEGDFDVRRFRPNILIETDPSIEGLAEFEWCGGLVRVGDVVVRCEARTVRCSMPALPQACGLARDTTVLRTVRDYADRHLGIYATVVTPGSIRIGDAVELHHPQFRPIRSTYDSLRKSMKRALLRGWAKIAE